MTAETRATVPLLPGERSFPAPSTDAEAAREVRDRRVEELLVAIKWTTLGRVLALSALLAFAISMDLGLGPQPFLPNAEVELYRLVSGFLIASFFELLAAFLLRARRQLLTLAAISLLLDVLLAGALVTMTGSLESMFLFVFPLAVLNGSALLQRPGALWAATGATICLAVLGAIEAGLLPVDLNAVTVAWLRALGPRPSLTGVQIASTLGVQAAAVYATALLSSYLVRELRRARMRAEAEQAALMALRVRYEDVVASLPDGLLSLASDGTVRSANPAAGHILGAEPSALVGHRIGEVLPDIELPDLGRSRHRSLELVREAASGRARQVLAIRVARLRGRGVGTDGRLLVLRDVTGARRREAEHRTRERLAAIGAMATAVAHEIRNPLASISGSVELIRSTAPARGDTGELMDIVVRETAQLSDWIGEFLDFARPREARFDATNLARLVCEKVRACRLDPRVRAAGTSLDVVDGDGAPAALEQLAGDAAFNLEADEAGLAQLVWNLLTNATQAALEREGERRVRVMLDGTAVEHVELIVEDSGRGLGDADAERLFEPFYTRKSEGTGLGLATVRRIVDVHHGRVVAGESELGGARFVVTLPRAQHPFDA